MMTDFAKYRVNAKKFSLKNHQPDDKSARSGSKEQDAIEPVSYTHLDVYKRQP